ncbi:hypothetical protein D3C71_1606540 [compost metagenome]
MLPYRLDDRGLRGRLVALHGRAGADLRTRRHQPACRTASGRLVRDAAAGARHHPHRQFEERQIPLLRAAYLLFRRRHQGDAAGSQGCAGACACWRYLQPQGQFRASLHSQPARHAGASASASEYRPGRSAVGRLLRHALRNRFRRHHDLLRLRLGGQGG